MAEWYYARGGQQMGPVSAAELDRLYREGVVGDADLVWSAGMDNWVPAGQARDRFHVAADAPVGMEGLGIPRIDLDLDRPVVAPVAGVGIGDYAGFWLRFLALIIDTVILAAIGGVLGCFIGAAMGGVMGAAGMLGPESGADDAALAMIQLVSSLVGWVVNILYFTILESSKWQATVGKMALGLKVTDTDGYPISFARALGRNLGKIVSGIICLIGYIMAGFTERKQALHDLMASTLVVRK